jgi:hypothetical protein
MPWQMFGKSRANCRHHNFCPISVAIVGFLGDPSRAPAFHGGQNNVDVISWNQTGSVSSRGTRAQIVAPFSATATAPELYVITSGISDYASPALRLNFAATDADEIAIALKLGGARLFGADKVHLMLFSTSGRFSLPFNSAMCNV